MTRAEMSIPKHIVTMAKNTAKNLGVRAFVFYDGTWFVHSENYTEDAFASGDITQHEFYRDLVATVTPKGRVLYE